MPKIDPLCLFFTISTYVLMPQPPRLRPSVLLMRRLCKHPMTRDDGPRTSPLCNKTCGLPRSKLPPRTGSSSAWPLPNFMIARMREASTPTWPTFKN